MDPIALLKQRQGNRSLRALAREIPCSAPYLSDVYNGNRLAGPKLLRFLGIEKEVTFRKVNGRTAVKANGARKRG
jgi:hypothetical protein